LAVADELARKCRRLLARSHPEIVVVSDDGLGCVARVPSHLPTSVAIPSRPIWSVNGAELHLAHNPVIRIRAFLS
jgi:hypothetical protein